MSFELCQDASTAQWLLAQIGVALDVLSQHTTTPEDRYFALWDEWSSIAVASWPNFKIPNRDYWLFRGALAGYQAWTAKTPRGSRAAILLTLHLSGRQTRVGPRILLRNRQVHRCGAGR